jgi:hypothetical protein
MNGASMQHLGVGIREPLSNKSQFNKYQGHKGQNWTSDSLSFTAPSVPFQILLMFNGSDSYQGDIAVDNVRMYCNANGTAPTDGPDPTSWPTSSGEGEYKIKFGGAKVDVNIPAFDVSDYLGDYIPGKYRVKFAGAQVGIEMPEVEGEGYIDDLFY